MMKITCVIQAGGHSSRMGQDKALMPFLGRPLIARVVGRLQCLTADIQVISNHPDDYAFLGLPCFPDLIPGSGPLGGLLTALQVSAGPAVAVLACDMPFVSPALLKAQADLLARESADLVVPRSPDGLEPLHAVYRRETCLPAIQAALSAGERKMVAWLESVRAREMPPHEIAVFDPDFIAFTNVNSPEDFRRAEAVALEREEGA